MNADRRNNSVELINVATHRQLFDSLHSKAVKSRQCSKNVCLGSKMLTNVDSGNARSKDEILRLAREFIDEYYESIKRSNSEQHVCRWKKIEEEVESTGTYNLTQTELVYGAKLAWRNAPRCIGRVQWSKLQVFDVRYVTTTYGMFEAICKHIQYATNKGNIRSAITIFPQRAEGKEDFRIWNSQLISYAAYEDNEDVIGDKLNLEFTQICQKLGWKGKGGKWDILPIVLSVNGDDPEWFSIPDELILHVPLTHPRYDHFDDLELQWYALPAVSSHLFDCGGLQFPAAPFNGWYMVSEIGSRDLCDNFRFNVVEEVGKLMGFGVRANSNLWRDKVVVEVNVAVMHSFQKHNVTIVDHHTTSETFMKHFENEHKLRGGCPADWIWIVPPISGSLTPVFHQEMLLYNLMPSYSYQEPAWKTHVWKRMQQNNLEINQRRTSFSFKKIARAVKFTSNLYGKTLSKRIKATILYATETGKSEAFAKKLARVFSYAFNAQVSLMSDYDIINLEHEALVLVVTSTFGNGDPPENGESFAKKLYAMKKHGIGDIEKASSMHKSTSFLRMLSGSSYDVNTEQSDNKLVNGFSAETVDRLNNVKFAVFALGSSAYPNFCEFGANMDNMLFELGAERLLNLMRADELSGQEMSFKLWAARVLQVSCEAFCLEDDSAINDAKATINEESGIQSKNVKIVKVNDEVPIETGLSKVHCRAVKTFSILTSKNLHAKNSSRTTQQIILDTKSSDNFTYEPGDHIAVHPKNPAKTVNAIIEHFGTIKEPDVPIKFMIQKEMQTPEFEGAETSTWVPHERLPQASVRALLSRYLDITSPPTANFLQVMAKNTNDARHKNRLQHLATNTRAYEEWKTFNYPTLSEVLAEFCSVKMDIAVLLTHLPILQPRFYSISSSSLLHKNQIHLTVAVVTYRTKNGNGPIHYGVCSNFLKNLSENDEVQCFYRSSSGFHLPSDHMRPIILVGPGTGVAPFRGFWQHRNYMKHFLHTNVGDMTLFFGCRTIEHDLYRDEKGGMLKSGVLTRSFLALSREPNVAKTYVQDLLLKEAIMVYEDIVKKRGHFYVCGDCTMAECVYQKLKIIIKQHGSMNDNELEKYMFQMKIEDRYHEDIFGITLRTEEVHRISRETARNKASS